MSLRNMLKSLYPVNQKKAAQDIVPDGFLYLICLIYHADSFICSLSSKMSLPPFTISSVML